MWAARITTFKSLTALITFHYKVKAKRQCANARNCGVSAHNEFPIQQTRLRKSINAERIIVKNAWPNFVIFSAPSPESSAPSFSRVAKRSTAKKAVQMMTPQNRLWFLPAGNFCANFLCRSRTAHANSQIISRLISWSGRFLPPRHRSLVKKNAGVLIRC